MSGYEAAPATVLLATHCCACGRPLVDAESVEAGMGPDCRKKYGHGVAQAPADVELAVIALEVMPDVLAAVWQPGTEARVFANRLVARVAVEDSVVRRGTMIGAIHALGFATLARKLLERANGIVIELDGELLVVRSPYSEQFNQHVRSVPGQRGPGQQPAAALGGAEGELPERHPGLWLARAGGAVTPHDKLMELKAKAVESLPAGQRSFSRFADYYLVRVTRTIKLSLGVTWKKGEYLIANPASTAYGKAKGFNFMAAWNQKNMCDSRVPANAVEAVMGSEEVS